MSQRSITSLLGNSQRLDGGAMFGNAPRALWSRWYEPDERNRIAMSCRAMLVRDGQRNILFEVGIGAFFEPKMKDRYGVVEDEHVLLASLADVGLEPADIDIIVLSHLHFDHAGGLLSAYEEGVPGALVFPNARYVVSAEAWERCKHPHVRDRASFIPGLDTLLERSGNLVVVDGETCDELGEGYRFRRSFGHTPGMLLTEVEMPSGPVLFAADLIPGAAWVHVPLTMGYDRYPELLIEEKAELLAEWHSRQGRLFYTHDPACALSGVSLDERGRFGASDGLASVRDLVS